MAFIKRDRVLQTSTSTGTGAIVLSGTLPGFETFASRMAIGDTTYVVVEAVDANGVPTGQWEVGIYTYSATNTLTRTTPLGGSATTPVSFAAGTKRVMLAPLAVRSHGLKVEIISAPGATWTPDPDLTTVEVILFGGGGGGANGRRFAAANGRPGGGGGGGGGMTRGKLPQSALGSSVIVTVGAGGLGAPLRTTDGSVAGTAGLETSFGTLLYAGGGFGGNAATTSNGNGGAGGSGTSMGGIGGSSTTTGGFISVNQGGGGGGGHGGSIDTGNISRFSGVGGRSVGANGGASGGNGTGGNGSNGEIPPAGVYSGGGGGGGGSSNQTGPSGAGGNGAVPGGGGGGSGGVTSGFDSAAGGNGGDGLAIIISNYF